MKAAVKLDQWRRSAIPFWLEHSWDQGRGGFYESLDLAGRPIQHESRRVRVQARQVYSFAKLHALGWAEGLALAEDGWAYIQKYAAHSDGGFVHSLTPDGCAENSMRDLYDHAFLLLAGATLWSVTKKPSYQGDCESILDFLDRRMAHPNVGFVESLGGPVSPRRQNPHMHLFEALMAYHHAGGAGALQRADAIKEMFSEYFYSAESGKLFEFFEDDFGAVSALKGEVAEPGHLAEWVWLLDQFSVSSDEEIDPAAKVMFECVLSQGVNPETGLLYASFKRSGTPIACESRTWMQTEWFRAASVAYRRQYDQAGKALDMASDGLFNHHFSGVPSGGWRDRIEADGQASMDRMPASTLYHVLGALIEADKILDTDLC